MSEFDITFELFTLLLGLTMAEVLAGYARPYKLRSRIRHNRLAYGDQGGDGVVQQVRIGWLVPLSAAVVLFHQATFWLFMFDVQGNVPVNFLSLLCVLGVIGWYYLISAALWPDEPEAWPDFDAYYMAPRRFIWFGVIAVALLADFGRALFEPPLEPTTAPAWIVSTVDWTNNVGSIAILAMPFIRSRRWAIAVLVVLNLHFVVLAVFSPWMFI